MTNKTVAVQTDTAADVSRILQDHIDVDSGNAEEILCEFLGAVRLHLGMDVAFVSQFCEGRRVLRYVDAAAAMPQYSIGTEEPLDETCCQRVVDGRMPQLVHNVQRMPGVKGLAKASLAPIGALLCVPIWLSDGTAYGTFCAFSFRANYSLSQRDLSFMRVFADIATRFIERDLRSSRETAEKRQRIQAVLDGDGLAVVFQPIVDIESRKVIGLESLARFCAPPARSPDVWFEEAANTGLGDALEERALEKALTALGQLPPGVYIACNGSPNVVLNGRIVRLLERVPLHRVVLEITERAIVNSYADLERALRPWRERGMRLAVDDVGAGYANFQHILNLRPDLMKLDMSLVRNIDADFGRRALASALVRFCAETGSELIAEGVETALELQTLRSLGVKKAQGYLLGRPGPIASALQLPQAWAA
jgi:EAL domain-containing protein (putative c-di-GMP-specific phosphodiesterase class I)